MSDTLRKGSIVVVTSTRADWGILRALCLELRDSLIALTIIVTGSHLDRDGDNSVEEIKKDFVDELVFIDILKTSGHSHLSMFETISNSILAYQEKLTQLSPKLLVILGDRYEIMSMAWVCRLLKIPLAHFSGGELTIGAFDDVMRHCITKLSDYHFVSNTEHYNRVRQLGENPNHIYNVGELAFSGLNEIQLKDAQQLELEYGFAFNDFFLITVHPETCNSGVGIKIIENLLDLLPTEYPEKTLIFTSANIDPEGLIINEFIIKQASLIPNIKYVKSFGRENYLSAAYLSKAVLGNSSSGVIEVPALGVPVVNIGTRQKGRPTNNFVINANVDKASISTALKKHSPFKKGSHIISNNSAKQATLILLKLMQEDCAPKNFTAEKAFFDITT